MAVSGYARVSAADQHIAPQLDALPEAGVDRVFRDQGIIGSTSERPGLSLCLDHLREGDVSPCGSSIGWHARLGMFST